MEQDIVSGVIGTCEKETSASAPIGNPSNNQNSKNGQSSSGACANENYHDSAATMD